MSRAKQLQKNAARRLQEQEFTKNGSAEGISKGKKKGHFDHVDDDGKKPSTSSWKFHRNGKKKSPETETSSLRKQVSSKGGKKWWIQSQNGKDASACETYESSSRSKTSGNSYPDDPGDTERRKVVRKLLKKYDDDGCVTAYKDLREFAKKEGVSIITIMSNLNQDERISVYSMLTELINLGVDDVLMHWRLSATEDLFHLMCGASLVGRHVLTDENVKTGCSCVQWCLNFLVDGSSENIALEDTEVATFVGKVDALLASLSRLQDVVRIPDESVIRFIDLLTRVILLGTSSSVPMKSVSPASVLNLRKTAMESVIQICNETKEFVQELVTSVLGCLPSLAENSFVRDYSLINSTCGHTKAKGTGKCQAIHFFSSFLLEFSEHVNAKNVFKLWKKKGLSNEYQINLSVATAVISSLIDYTRKGYLGINWAAFFQDVVSDILLVVGQPEWPTSVQTTWMIASKLLTTLQEFEKEKSLTANDRKLGFISVSLLGDVCREVLRLRRLCTEYAASFRIRSEDVYFQSADCDSSTDTYLREPVAVFREWILESGNLKTDTRQVEDEKPVQTCKSGLLAIIGFQDLSDIVPCHSSTFAAQLNEYVSCKQGRRTWKDLSSGFETPKSNKVENKVLPDSRNRNDAVDSDDDFPGVPDWVKRLLLRECLHSAMVESVYEQTMRDISRKFCLALWASGKSLPPSDAERVHYMMQYDLPKHLWKDGSMGMETLSRERFVALYLHSVLSLPLLANFNILLSGMLRYAGASVSKWRQKVVDGLRALIEVDETLANLPVVQQVIETRFRDESISVRSSVVEFLGNHVEKNPVLVKTFIQPLKDKLNDTGLSVRKQVVKILQRLLKGYFGKRNVFSLSDEDKQNVSSVLFSLVQRAVDPNEEPSVRDIVFNTCYELWFDHPVSQNEEDSTLDASVSSQIMTRAAYLALLSHHSLNSMAMKEHTHDGLVPHLTNFLRTLLGRYPALTDTSKDIKNLGRYMGDAFTAIMENSGDDDSTCKDYSKALSQHKWQKKGDILVGFVECLIRILVPCLKETETLGTLCKQLQISASRLPVCILLILSEFCRCVPSYALKHLPIFQSFVKKFAAELDGESAQDSLKSLASTCKLIQHIIEGARFVDLISLQEFCKEICQLLNKSSLDLTTTKNVVQCLRVAADLGSSQEGVKHNPIASLVNAKYYALQKLLVALHEDTGKEVSIQTREYENQPLLAKQAAMKSWLAWLCTGTGQNKEKMLRDACFALKTSGIIVRYASNFCLQCPFEIDGVDVSTHEHSDFPSCAWNLAKLYIAWLHWMTNAEFLRGQSDRVSNALNLAAMRIMHACIQGLSQLCIESPQFLLLDIVQKLFRWILRHQVAELRTAVIESLKTLLDAQVGRSTEREGFPLAHHDRAKESTAYESDGEETDSDDKDETGEILKGEDDPNYSAFTGALQVHISDIRRQFFHPEQNLPSLRLSTLRLWSALVSQRIVDPDEGCIPLVALLGDFNSTVRQHSWKALSDIQEKHNSTLCRISTKGLAAAYAYQCKLYGVGLPDPPRQLEYETPGEFVSASFECFYGQFYKRILMEGGDNRYRSKAVLSFLRSLIAKFRCPSYVAGDSDEDSDDTFDDNMDDEGDEQDLPAGLDVRRGPAGGTLSNECCPFQEGIRALSNVNMSNTFRCETEQHTTERKYTRDAMLLEKANGVLRESKRQGIVADVSFLKFLAEVLFCLPYGKRHEVYAVCHSAQDIISIQGEQSRDELANDNDLEQGNITEENAARIRSSTIQLLAVVYLQILRNALIERYNISEQQLIRYNPKKGGEASEGERNAADRFPHMQLSYPQIPSPLRRPHGWVLCKGNNSSLGHSSLARVAQNLIDLFDSLQSETGIAKLKELGIVVAGRTEKVSVAHTPRSAKSTRSRTPQSGETVVVASSANKVTKGSAATSSKPSKKCQKRKQLHDDSDDDNFSIHSEGDEDDSDIHETYVPRKSTKRTREVD